MLAPGADERDGDHGQQRGGLRLELAEAEHEREREHGEDPAADAEQAGRDPGREAEREATGTSLAAIVLIGIVAATLQGVYGNLRYGYGLAIGIPAVAGVVAGTWLQQRIPTRWITRGFSLLLVGIAIELLA